MTTTMQSTEITTSTKHAVPTHAFLETAQRRIPVAEVWAVFDAFAEGLDLAPIKYKLIKEGGWTPERADRTEPAYKAFLFLIGIGADQMLVPTHDIDEMWHAHVLDTRKYMADCDHFFGEYIHHYPYLGLKDEEDKGRAETLFADTCATIRDTLGINIRNVEAADCGGGGCGGGGSSCGGGGSSCSSGGSSCSSGHSSCGSGHGGGTSDSGHGHGHGHGNSDAGIIPTIISSCSSSESPARRTPDPAPTRSYVPTPSDTRRPIPTRQPGRSTPTPAPAPSRPEKKRNIIRRILDLASSENSWDRSVTPAYFPQNEYRPDAEALQKLTIAKRKLH